MWLIWVQPGEQGYRRSWSHHPRNSLRFVGIWHATNSWLMGTDSTEGCLPASVEILKFEIHSCQKLGLGTLDDGLLLGERFSCAVWRRQPRNILRPCWHLGSQVISVGVAVFVAASNCCRRPNASWRVAGFGLTALTSWTYSRGPAHLAYVTPGRGFLLVFLSLGTYVFGLLYSDSHGLHMLAE